MVWSAGMVTLPAATSLPLSHTCLLYTSPSPRDGLLSSSSAARDVYKRQRVEIPDLRRIPDLRDGLVRRDGDITGRDQFAIIPHLSLIHISEPTRRPPILFVGSARCV